MHRGLPLLVEMAALSIAVACGSAGGKGRNEAVKDKGLNPEMGLSDQAAGDANQRGGEQQPGGTSGQSGRVTLSGCLDKNLETGQFVIVTQDKQPGRDHVTLQEGPGVKLNASVGKHVTVAGAMANGRADAFPRGYRDSAKPEGTNDQQRLLVSALQKVGDDCSLENR